MEFDDVSGVEGVHVGGQPVLDHSGGVVVVVAAVVVCAVTSACC